MPAKSTRAKAKSAKASTKKSAAAKTNGKPASKPASNGRTAINKQLVDKVAPLKAEGKNPAQIAKALRINEHAALIAGRVSEVKKADRITNLTAEQVVNLRASGLAWHTIEARTVAGSVYGNGSPIAIATIKKMYKEATGKQPRGHAKKNGGPRKAGTRGGQRGR